VRRDERARTKVAAAVLLVAASTLICVPLDVTAVTSVDWRLRRTAHVLLKHRCPAVVQELMH